MRSSKMRSAVGDNTSREHSNFLLFINSVVLPEKPNTLAVPTKRGHHAANTRSLLARKRERGSDR